MIGWEEKCKDVAEETRVALQAVFDELNQGQRSKLLKNEEVKALLDHYGVDTSGLDAE